MFTYSIVSHVTVGQKKLHYAFNCSLDDFYAFVLQLESDGFIVICEMHDNVNYYIACESAESIPDHVCFGDQNVIGFITEE